jgi:pimeloyl-ACP methyl ester carboxylesterase
MTGLVREGVTLAYEEAGDGAPAIVLVHGVACHRGFWTHQMEHFSRRQRVVAVDLRGHGASDAPAQPYTIDAFAGDVAWMCEQLALTRPVVVGHSLGGLIALALAACHPHQIGAAVLIDSVLLAAGDRSAVIGELVASQRTPDADRALRDYFATFFSPNDDPRRTAWILDQAMRTPPHVTSSIWEESLRAWDDGGALRHCEVPLLYLDAGTPNADLARALALRPELVIGRTIGSGHFSLLEVPEQVNAMIDRFLTVSVDH